MMDFLRIEQGEGRMLEDAFDNGYIANIAACNVHADRSVISSDGIEYLTSKFEFIRVSNFLIASKNKNNTRSTRAWTKWTRTLEK